MHKEQSKPKKRLASNASLNNRKCSALHSESNWVDQFEISCPFSIAKILIELFSVPSSHSMAKWRLIENKLFE